MNISEQIQKNIEELSFEKKMEVLDFVLFLRVRGRTSNATGDAEGRREIIRESLEKLAKMKAFSEIDDPVEWQREIRRDRPLPGREE